jgi:hypothetical protein
MKSVRTFVLAVALAAGTLTAAAADPVTVGDIELTGLWTRATPPSAPAGGGFLTITNTGTEADRLVKVEAAHAGMSEVHQMKMVDGVMEMREVEGGLEIPPGETVTLAPGGFHLMFMGLKAGQKQGAALPVTLTFERAGPVDVLLDVYPIGSPGPQDEDQ